MGLRYREFNPRPTYFRQLRDPGRDPIIFVMTHDPTCTVHVLFFKAKPRTAEFRAAEEEPTVGAAGVGTVGGSRRGDPQADAPLSCRPTQNKGGSSAHTQHARQPLPVNGSSVNGYGSGSASGFASGSSAPAQSSRQPTTVTQSSQPPYRPLHDPTAEPIDPTAEMFIKVGSNAYKVDLSKDPQKQRGSLSRAGGECGQSTNT